LVRLYLPLIPEALPLAAETLVRHAPPAARWAAKFLCGAHDGPRRDPGLIYLPHGDHETGWVLTLLDALGPMLGGCRVRGAAPWRGVWLADDPGGEQSFGQMLCSALAAVAEQDRAVLDDGLAFKAAASERLMPLMGHWKAATG
jgi:hypothetical protein